MERIIGGDAESFARLFERYSPIAMALARRILGPSHLAEETVQEAFLAVWRAPDGYRSRHGSVRTWLMSIVHNRAVDCVRREETQRTRALHLGDLSLADSGPPDPGEVVVNDIGFLQERTLARRALSDLPPAQRQIIDLMYFGGLSQTQIATMLELPLGTVKSRTLLGMRRLRLALSEIER